MRRISAGQNRDWNFLDMFAGDAQFGYSEASDRQQAVRDAIDQAAKALPLAKKQEYNDVAGRVASGEVSHEWLEKCRIIVKHWGLAEG